MYPLNSNSPSSPFPQVPGSNWSVYCLSGSACSGCFIYMESSSLWLCLSGLFCSAYFQNLFILKHVSIFHSFFFNISFLFVTDYYFIRWIYHICLSVHHLMDIRVVSAIWLLWNQTCERLCKNFCVDINFQLAWVRTWGGIAGSCGNSLFNLLRKHLL